MLKYDDLPSDFAFTLKLRRYITAFMLFDIIRNLPYYYQARGSFRTTYRTVIGARLTSSVIAHTHAPTRFNTVAGRPIYAHLPPIRFRFIVDPTSVETLLSMTLLLGDQLRAVRSLHPPGVVLHAQPFHGVPR